MTFSTIYTMVFRLMRDTGQDKYDLATVKAWVNDAEQRYCALTGYSVKKDETITSVASQQEYTLPTDIKSVIDVWWGYTHLIETDIEKTVVENNSGTPYAYYVRNNKLGLHPVPGTTGTTIRLVYRSIGGDMTDASDTPIIPEEHQMALVYSPCVMCSLEGDDDRGPMFQGKWNALIQQAVVEGVQKSYADFPVVGEDSMLGVRRRDIDTGVVGGSY